MSLTNTNIQLQRSANELDVLLNKDYELNFGEPFFIDNTTHDSNGKLTDPVNAFIAVGRKQGSDEQESITLSKSPIIKAFSLDKAKNIVFKSNNGSIVDESNKELPVNRVTSKTIGISDLSDSNRKYYILCQPDNDNTIYKFNLSSSGIYIDRNGRMRGAAWNDYAEFRKIEGDAIPGQVVCDTGHGTLKLSEKRLQPCAHVVSDTYGHIIGDEKDSVPIAVAGRAIVNIDSNIGNIELGDCVCAGPNGFATKMTSQEISSCPDKILGVVCEVIDAQKVWINIK